MVIRSQRHLFEEVSKFEGDRPLGKIVRDLKKADESDDAEVILRCCLRILESAEDLTRDLRARADALEAA